MLIRNQETSLWSVVVVQIGNRQVRHPKSEVETSIMAVIDIIVVVVVVVVVIVKNGGITTTIVVVVEVVDMTVVGLVVIEVMTEAVVIEVMIEAVVTEVVIEVCGRHRLLRGGLGAKTEMLLPVAAVIVIVGLTKLDHPIIIIDAIQTILLLQPQPQPQPQ